VPTRRTTPSAHSPESRAVVKTDVSVLPFMKHYAEFQISDGVAGNAAAEAAAVFLDPFEGTDLASVPYETYDRLIMARGAAEDAEIELFDPAIEDAEAEGSEWLVDALEAGMAKNRVLYIVASMQAMQIRMAQNRARNITDPYEEEDLNQVEADLRWVVNADQENYGKKSMSALYYDFGGSLVRSGV